MYPPMKTVATSSAHAGAMAPEILRTPDWRAGIPWVDAPVWLVGSPWVRGSGCRPLRRKCRRSTAAR